MLRHYESWEKEKANHLLHIETLDGCKAHSLYTRAVMWTFKRLFQPDSSAPFYKMLYNEGHCLVPLTGDAYWGECFCPPALLPS